MTWLNCCRSVTQSTFLKIYRLKYEIPWWIFFIGYGTWATIRPVSLSFYFFKSLHKEFTNGSCICRSSRSFGDVFGSFSLISIKVCLRFFEGWSIPQMGLSKARLFRKGTYGGGHVEFPKDLTRFWSGRVWNPRSSTIFLNSSMVSGGCSLAYLWRSNLVYGSAISTRSLWRLELFLKNGSLNVYYFD